MTKVLTLLLLTLTGLNTARAITVSGYVRDNMGAGLAGARVFLPGNPSEAAITDTDGRFTFDSDKVSSRRRPSEKAVSRHLAKPGGTVSLMASKQYYHNGESQVTDGDTAALIVLEKLPNIVLILSDDHGWTDYGFMGHDTIETPHLDRLAKESMVFTRGHVPFSVCRPSILTLCTGLHTHEHGLHTGPPPPELDPGYLLKHIDSAVTVQKLLHERQGYVTLQTGKWWEGSFKRGHFTHGMTHGKNGGRGDHGDDGLTIGREGMGPIPRFIDSAGEKPFYIYYAPKMPHVPHDPPDSLREKYLQHTDNEWYAGYWAMVEWFDRTCGELIQVLEDKGVRDNTIIFYLADNGWTQGLHNWGADGKSKLTPYDKGIRTPVMVSWPGKVTPGRDEQTLVVLVRRSSGIFLVDFA